MKTPREYLKEKLERPIGHNNLDQEWMAVLEYVHALHVEVADLRAKIEELQKDRAE